MRVLILADSLAIPRPHRGQSLEVTWPAQLKKAISSLDIWQRARPASTIYELYEEFNLFSDSLDCFDALVLQVGITDCCPRPDPYFLHRFIAYFCSKRFQKLINSNYQYLLKVRAKPWVSRSDFEKHFRLMIDKSLLKNPKLKVAIIKIGPPCHEFVKKVPAISKFVSEYNSIIDLLAQDANYKAQVKIVDPYTKHAPEKIMIEDGHHLTELGHSEVTKSLIDAGMFTS